MHLDSPRGAALAVLAVGLALALSACSIVPSEVSTVPAVVSLQRITGTNEVSWTYGCLGTAREAIKDLACRKIRIAVENAYLPFNYIDLKTGLASGWDYDAWKVLCTRLHCAPVFVETPWDGMIDAVGLKEFDAAADGITIKEERKQKVDFSDPYMAVEQRLLVRADESRFTTIQDFNSQSALIIGTQSQTTNFDTAVSYVTDKRVKGFDQFPQAIQALIDGKVDAIVIDEATGQGYIAQMPGKIKLVGPSLSSDELGFIFPKGSDLIGPINQALAAMKADGTLKVLASTYFGPDFKVTAKDIATPSYSATQQP